MKTLEMKEMENVSGGSMGCVVMGALTIVSLPLSFFTFGAATLGVLIGSAAMGCFETK